MTCLRLARRMVAGTVAAIVWLAGAHAAADTAPPKQDAIDALTRAVNAVVGIEVTAAEGATSGQTLGRQRSGSGVVIGPAGLILTIGYLIVEADTIQVSTEDRRVFPARTVAYDVATGFGLVQTLLPLERVQPVVLGSVADVPAHSMLMAVAGGDEGGVAVTQHQGTRPFSGYWEYHIDAALFTSPPIANHSGAALFNRRGELVGIGSLFVADAFGDGRWLPGNMFVPVDLLKPILAEMQQTGSTRSSHRPWLGLSSSERDGRVQIVRVSRNSPASAAGLSPGDVVLEVDGHKVNTLEAFYKQLWARPEPESEVVLTVLQGADVHQVHVHAIDRMKTMRRPAGI